MNTTLNNNVKDQFKYKLSMVSLNALVLTFYNKGNFNTITKIPYNELSKRLLTPSELKSILIFTLPNGIEINASITRGKLLLLKKAYSNRILNKQFNHGR